MLQEANAPILEHRSNDYIRWYPKSLTLHRNQTPRTSRVEGAYIHVPFCAELCGFCPYNKRLLDSELRDRYVAALCREIVLWSKQISGPLEFVYFGGGTPSTLTPAQIATIVDELDRALGLTPDAEITLEAFPTDLSKQSVAAFVDAGISRVSSGIQSLRQETLSSLGARHDRGQAMLAIDVVAQAIGGIAIDMLYRVPGQTLTDWEHDLLEILRLDGIDHLSLYSLVLDDESAQPSSRIDLEMAALGLTMGAAQGYVHYASCASGGYDIARPGSKSRYELRHWQAPQASFVGLGPGALGFVDGGTTANALSLGNYLDAIDEGRLPLICWQPHDIDELMHRYFVLGVKTLEVELGPFVERFGSAAHTKFQRIFEDLVAAGALVVDDERIVLTSAGRLAVDQVSAAFFSDAQAPIPHPEEPQLRRVESAVFPMHRLVRTGSGS